jgi:imidazole glycerol-phosphate synthase subunit HisF
VPMLKKGNKATGKMDAERKDLLSFAEGGMFHGTPPQIFEMANQLRKNMTEAEKILWFHLKLGVNGLKFRRQHPIGIYVADFYCHKMKLVIELDGTVHDNAEVAVRDKQREDNLRAWGYEIIRFTNEQIHTAIESVIRTIEIKTVEFLKHTKNIQ